MTKTNSSFLVKKGVEGENFVEEGSFGSSGSAENAVKVVKVGGCDGRVVSQMVAGKGGFTLEAGKKVTLTATVSDTVDGTFESCVSNSYTAGSSAAESFAEGAVIVELAFPCDVKPFAKVTPTTDMAAAASAGKFLVAPEL